MVRSCLLTKFHFAVHGERDRAYAVKFPSRGMRRDVNLTSSTPYSIPS